MIYFITGNKGKFQEAWEVLGKNLQQLDIDLSEIQELDPKVIISRKLKEARRRHKGEIIVDDVSLYFSCFSYEFPGPLIKWMLHVLKIQGLFEIVKKYNDFGVLVELNLGYMDKKGKISFFCSRLKGKIVSPKGENGFGWDPIFLPENCNKTYAELNAQEAWKIKVRYKAFRKLKNFLIKNGKIRNEI